MFLEEDKRIYGPYKNGARAEEGQIIWVVGDPLRIYRKLIRACNGRLQETLDAQQAMHQGGMGPGGPVAPEPDHEARYRAFELLVQAAREAFDLLSLDPISGQGCTDAEALDLLDKFLEWLEKNEQPVKILPTSTPTMDSPPIGIP